MPKGHTGRSLLRETSWSRGRGKEEEEEKAMELDRHGCSEQVTMGCHGRPGRWVGQALQPQDHTHLFLLFRTTSLHPRLPSSTPGCLPSSPRLPKGTQICLKNPWPGRHSSFFYRQLHHSPKWDGVWDRTWSTKGALQPCEVLYKQETKQREERTQDKVSDDWSVTTDHVTMGSHFPSLAQWVASTHWL